jgi:hypothetical protein
VGGIVGGVEIEQDLAPLQDLVAAETDELLAQPVVEVHQFAGGRRVLPTAERGLRTERVAQFLIGDDLQHGIVAQTIGVVGVFVAGDDLIDALPQQRQRRKNRRGWVDDGRRRRSAVVKHFVSSDGCSERECWVCKPSVHHSF